MQSLKDRDYADRVLCNLVFSHACEVNSNGYFEYAGMLVKIDDGVITFLDELSTNTLYILSRTKKTQSYIAKYDWTYDAIVDLTQGIVAEYQNGYLTERKYDSLDRAKLLRHLKGASK